MRSHTEYALAIFGRPIGPWRATKREAEKDAIRTGNGNRDRYSKTVFLTVPADIVSRRIELARDTRHQGRQRCVGMGQ